MRVLAASAVLALVACGGARKQEAVARLMQAAAAGDTTALAAALADGAGPDAVNDSGATALMLACRSSRTAVVRALLGRKVDPNLKDAKGRAALLYALSPSGHDSAAPAIVGMLLQAGADPNAPDGPAPALVAAAFLRTRAMDVARMLLEHGAWIDIRDVTGRSALMVAVQQDRVELVQYLLTQGADLNARDNNGKSIVNHAARKPDILGMLFRSGARPR